MKIRVIQTRIAEYRVSGQETDDELLDREANYHNSDSDYITYYSPETSTRIMLLEDEVENEKN